MASSNADEVVGGRLLHLQVLAEIRDVQQAAIVHTKIQERLLQFQDAPHAEEGSHVAFEDLVHNVFAEKFLGLGMLAVKALCGKPPRKRYSWKWPTKGSASAARRENGFGPIERVGQRSQPRDARRGGF